MSPTIHLVYPHGKRVSCPDAIGRNVGKRLERDYPVRYYDYASPEVIRPAKGDVLLGHPHSTPWTVFRRSMKQPGWGRVIAMSPYHHGDLSQVAFLDSCLPHCDLYLAITGNYWFDSIERSLFAHWRPKMVHLDLAVDRDDFPPVKKDFNDRGKRKFVYIGSAIRTKNPGYLSQIARQMNGTEFGWFGSGRTGIRGLREYGFRDFAERETRDLLAGHDFAITVGRADANPATILESMAWGLIPVCTPQSGYEGYPGIVNVPLDDLDGAVRILEELQSKPEAELKAMQGANWRLLAEHFNWDRFSGQVKEAIEGASSPALLPETRARKLFLQGRAWTAPSSPLNPVNLLRKAKRSWKPRCSPGS